MDISLERYEAFKIPLNSSPLEAANTLRDAFTDHKFRCIADSGQMLYNNYICNFNYPDNVFDGSPVTSAYFYQNASQGEIAYAGLVFTEAKAVAKVRIISGNSQNAITSFDLQWSDDPGTAPTNWTTHETLTRDLFENHLPSTFTVSNPEPHRSWRIAVKTPDAVYVGIESIRFYDVNGNPATPANQIHLDIVPKASEPIGNANGFDFLRVTVTDSAIQFAVKRKLLLGLPQVIVLGPKTAGINSNAVTIDGVMVQQDPTTLTGTNTALQNLEFLYEALRASTDPKITAWDWEWVSGATLNADETSVIRGSKKLVENNVAVTANANVTLIYNAHSRPAGEVSDMHPSFEGGNTYGNVESYTGGCGLKLNVDYTYGYVLYLASYSRGFNLASKTSSKVTGILSVEWADNAWVNNCLPKPINRWLTPVELFITGVGDGFDLTSGATYIRVGHMLAIANAHKHSTYYQPYYSSNFTANPSQIVTFRNRIFDCEPPNGISGSTYDTVLTASGIWPALNSIGDDFQIHRMTLMAPWTVTADNVTMFVPPTPLRYTFQIAGTISDEQLLLVSDVEQAATLVNDLSKDDNPNFIALSDTSKLAATGLINICGEGFNELVYYTSKDANGIYGCVRGRYATKRRNYKAGEDVRQGLWFIKLGKAAMFIGYTAPV